MKMLAIGKAIRPFHKHFRNLIYCRVMKVLISTEHDLFKLFSFRIFVWIIHAWKC